MANVFGRLIDSFRGSERPANQDYEDEILFIQEIEKQSQSLAHITGVLEDINRKIDELKAELSDLKAKNESLAIDRTANQAEFLQVVQTTHTIDQKLDLFARQVHDRFAALPTPSTLNQALQPLVESIDRLSKDVHRSNQMPTQVMPHSEVPQTVGNDGTTGSSEGKPYQIIHQNQNAGIFDPKGGSLIHSSNSAIVSQDNQDPVIQQQASLAYSQMATVLEPIIQVTPEEKSVADSYNKRMNLDEFTTEVNATDDSMNARRSGSPEPPMFEVARRGSYHIITIQERTYLVPKPDMKITEFTLQSLRTLFDCENLASDSDSFTLVKPGRVEVLRKGEWRLVESGVLQFQSS